MKLTSTLTNALVGCVLGLLLSACGSGESSNTPLDDGGLPADNSNGNVNTLTGRFVDSPVAGLTYATSSGLTGTTNAAGEFEFLSGDEITFTLGPIDLGTVTGASRITPFDLAGFVLPGIDVDLTDLAGDIFLYDRGDVTPFAEGVNRLIFLQSLDRNNDPSDGIDIGRAVVDFFFTIAAALLFNQNEGDFLIEFLALFTQLVTNNVLDRDLNDSPLVDSDDAIKHFLRTLATEGRD